MLKAEGQKMRREKQVDFFRKRKKLFLLLGAGLFAGFLFICTRKQGEFSEETHRYICILPPQEEYYWGEIKEGIRDADNEFGCMTKIETFEQFDIERQEQLLAQTEYYHVDGIITIGQEQEELVEEIRNCVDRGTPVVLLDADSPDSGRDCYIGTDNYQAGTEAAREIIKRMDSEEIKAAVYLSGKDSTNQSERLRGFYDGMQKYDGKWSVVVEQRLSEAEAFQQLLEMGLGKKTFNAVFCADASTTQQVGLYLNNSGMYEEIVMVGFDEVGQTSQLIKKGVITGCLVQDTHEMGYTAVQTLENLNEGKVMEPNIYTSIYFNQIK